MKSNCICPSVSIIEGYYPGLKKEVIGKVSVGTFEFRLITNNPSDISWVVYDVFACCEPHGLISEDVICAILTKQKNEKLIP